MRRILLTLTLCLAWRLDAAAAEPPSLDQSLELASVSNPKLSPDGGKLVYVQSRTNWDANAFESDLWLADLASGERRRLTLASKSSSAAEWSPDGRWIAFLSDRVAPLPGSPADKKQLYVMPADGGEAQQITKLEKGVGSFVWAPDSRHLAVTAEMAESKAQKERKDSFGEYHVFHADYAMNQLWLTALPDSDEAGRTGNPAKPIALSGEDLSVVDNHFAFSPDGQRIAFAAQKDPDLISADSRSIYMVGIEDRKVSQLLTSPGPSDMPRWSPDGRRIAYQTAAGAANFFFSNRMIAVVDAQGGAGTVITRTFDENADLLGWSEQGIYFSARQKTESGLFLTDPAGKAQSRIALAGTPMAAQFSFSADFRRVAYRGAAANKAWEIWQGDIGSTPHQVTAAMAQWAALTHGQRELISWNSRDGNVIEGVLYKPNDFEAGRKYPLLVVIHGGPTGIDVPALDGDRYYPIERFLARGALVLRPNYRGSAGYGGKFRALNVRNLGIGDYEDVISGVDHLIKAGLVDRAKVAAMGWSQGGYISAFITASSDRFQAVSVGAGISDWMTYYVNTDITPFTRQYLGATPWQDGEIYRKTSPISYIAKAQTPTLIQHGGSDKRVPIANAFELRQALEDRGVPVKLVIYDGFGHPINKPKQQRAVMAENENWFGHYLWGDALEPSLTPSKNQVK